MSEISVPLDDWTRADEAEAAERLTSASNDAGLTGLVFMRDIETHDRPDSDMVTVRVKANRPLSSPETDLVRARLLDH